MQMKCVWKAAMMLPLILSGTLPAQAADEVEGAVRRAVEPVMAEEDIPGLSVGLLVKGEPRVFHFGRQARQGDAAVTDRTLFEIGSLSKTYTGTLLGRLAAEGTIDLSARAESVLPALEGHPLGGATLQQLATYTSGGLPLQVPDTVTEATLLPYLQAFQPESKIGTERLYSNVAIGLSGFLAAKAAGAPFAAAMESKLFSPLNLKDTMLVVPKARQADYAQGYRRDNAPVRVTPGLFDEQAYGVKTTARDVLKFLAAAAKPEDLPFELAEGFRISQRGVYRVKAMHQGLGWELYAAPAELNALMQGADPDFILKPNPVGLVGEPVTGPAVGTLSKTGSTAGFGAYALLQPARNSGIVLLANRFWPNDRRIRLAHDILAAVDPDFFAQ
ncbi:serine hydrolase [Rhizobium sp. YIM 134829]|uniref:serine hydrolase n=1 Tax=Rhizobium sp. YIM 134829 TaxID=3390453 RepID=UPI003978CAD8